MQPSISKYFAKSGSNNPPRRNDGSAQKKHASTSKAPAASPHNMKGVIDLVEEEDADCSVEVVQADESALENIRFDPSRHENFAEAVKSTYCAEARQKQQNFPEISDSMRVSKTNATVKKYTPLESQILQLRSQYPDSLLMVECGYRMRFFGSDATTAAKVLGIYAHKDHNFMVASVPTYRAVVHCRRLVAAGLKVAIVRQTESAAIRKASSSIGSKTATHSSNSGTFQRAVMGIFTPGLNRKVEEFDPAFFDLVKSTANSSSELPCDPDPADSDAMLIRGEEVAEGSEQEAGVEEDQEEEEEEGETCIASIYEDVSVPTCSSSSGTLSEQQSSTIVTIGVVFLNLQGHQVHWESFSSSSSSSSNKISTVAATISNSSSASASASVSDGSEIDSRNDFSNCATHRNVYEELNNCLSLHQPKEVIHPSNISVTMENVLRVMGNLHTVAAEETRRAHKGGINTSRSSSHCTSTAAFSDADLNSIKRFACLPAEKFLIQPPAAAPLVGNDTREVEIKRVPLRQQNHSPSSAIDIDIAGNKLIATQRESDTSSWQEFHRLPYCCMYAVYGLHSYLLEIGLEEALHFPTEITSSSASSSSSSSSTSISTCLRNASAGSSDGSNDTTNTTISGGVANAQQSELATHGPHCSFALDAVAASDLEVFLPSSSTSTISSSGYCITNSTSGSMASWLLSPSSSSSRRKRGSGGGPISLLQLINHCHTVYGRRLLRYWLQHPLLCAHCIHQRQDAVTWMAQVMQDMQNYHTGPEVQWLHHVITDVLRGYADIEGLCTSLQHVRILPKRMLRLLRCAAATSRKLQPSDAFSSSSSSSSSYPSGSGSSSSCCLPVILQQACSTIPFVSLRHDADAFLQQLDDSAAQADDIVGVMCRPPLITLFPELASLLAQEEAIEAQFQEELLEIRRVLRMPHLEYKTLRTGASSAIEHLVEVPPNLGLVSSSSTTNSIRASFSGASSTSNSRSALPAAASTQSSTPAGSSVHTPARIPEDWVKTNSTKQLDRYLTPAVIKLQERQDAVRDEIKFSARSGWRQWAQQVKQQLHRPLRRAVQVLALVDAISSLAKLTTLPGYVQPVYCAANATTTTTSPSYRSNRTSANRNDHHDSNACNSDSNIRDDGGKGNDDARTTELRIVDGRNPLVEAYLERGLGLGLGLGGSGGGGGGGGGGGDNPNSSASAITCIPNDVLLRCHFNQRSCQVVTGPNMGGKSSYVRMIALICLLGQIGAHVPAESAHLCIFDRIFTRMGAGDDLASGQSSFMRELGRTSVILQQATPRSLVIFDELGRGTATHDGLAIAQATLTYCLNTIGCALLFVTHFPQVTDLVQIQEHRQQQQQAHQVEKEKEEEEEEEVLVRRSASVESFSTTNSGIAMGRIGQAVNVHMGYLEREDEDENDESGTGGDAATKGVVFLYKAVEGASQGSYGLHVARMAGMSADLLSLAAHRAQWMTQRLSNTRTTTTQTKPTMSGRKSKQELAIMVEQLRAIVEQKQKQKQTSSSVGNINSASANDAPRKRKITWNEEDNETAAAAEVEMTCKGPAPNNNDSNSNNNGCARAVRIDIDHFSSILHQAELCIQLHNH